MFERAVAVYMCWLHRRSKHAALSHVVGTPTVYAEQLCSVTFRSF